MFILIYANFVQNRLNRANRMKCITSISIQLSRKSNSVSNVVNVSEKSDAPFHAWIWLIFDFMLQG